MGIYRESSQVKGGKGSEDRIRSGVTVESGVTDPVGGRPEGRRPGRRCPTKYQLDFVFRTSVSIIGPKINSLIYYY